MVYVVERYLPGLDQHALETSLGRLREEAKGTPVTYLGSTIVPTDEACFRVPFDRIVAAVAVHG
jgi:hypothetical protein